MKKALTFFFIFAVTVACSALSSATLAEQNFPLRQDRTIVVGAAIEEIAVLDTWISVATSDKITGFDIDTQKPLWSVDFSVITYADPGFRVVDDMLLAASADQLIVADRSGVIRNIDLNPEGGTITRLSAAYSNYVYIIRGPRWILEVYDFLNNELLWTAVVERGGRDAFYDESKDTTYVPTSNNSILAFDNSSGAFLWRKSGSVLHSAFEEGILYTFEQMDGANNYSFAATDVETQIELWRQGIVLTATQRVEVLSIVNDLLVAGTGRGLIALEKSTGQHIWHILKDDAFHTTSVQLNSILFAKGLNGIVYAIHLDDGSIIGTVRLGNPGSFYKNYEVYAGVHKLSDGILFNTKDTIFIYKTE